MTLFDDISAALAKIGHGWTSDSEAHAMAAVILALHPEISVEIGVYAGKGLVSMGLAHREVGVGHVIGIDPYLPAASVVGQVNEADKKFWGTLDHEAIYALARDNIANFGLQNVCQIWRSKSEDVEPPKNIGLLRIDGNHGDAVLSDVARYCPNVIPGGVLFLDDLEWSGGAVMRAAAQLRMKGWRELYRIDGGLAFQKIAP